MEPGLNKQYQRLPKGRAIGFPWVFPWFSQPAPRSLAQSHLYSQGQLVFKCLGMITWGGSKGFITRVFPSGRLLHNYGKSRFLMGKLTISMAISNSFVKLPEGNWFYGLTAYYCSSIWRSFQSGYMWVETTWRVGVNWAWWSFEWKELSLQA